MTHKLKIHRITMNTRTLVSVTSRVHGEFTTVPETVALEETQKHFQPNPLSHPSTIFLSDVVRIPKLRRLISTETHGKAGRRCLGILFHSPNRSLNKVKPRNGSI